MSLLQRNTSVFKGLTIAIAGDSGEGWSEASMEAWIKNEDGKFSSTVTDSVTHLLCTEEEFKKGKGRDEKGQALKKAKTHVVDFRWLDLSIWSPNKRKLPEEGFSLRKTYDAERLQAREKARLEKGLLRYEKGGVNPNCFHPYSDSTYFSYRVDLVRADGQRHELCLYESNTKPHSYQVGGVFQDKPKGQLKYYREEHPCSFEAQYDHFKRIFLKKTGVNWDARLVKPYVDDGFHFRYTPPVGGKPVGLVPEEFMPHEDAGPAPGSNAVAEAAVDDSSSKPDNDTSPVSVTIAEATGDVQSRGSDNEATEAGPVDVQMVDV